MKKPLLATAIILFVSLGCAAKAPEAVCTPTPASTTHYLTFTTLGSSAQDADNDHLNQTDARILLRMELEALKKAIMAREATETRKHLTNALVFRKYRYQLYPDAAASENKAELSQGLVAYNELEDSKKKAHEILPYLVGNLNNFLANQSYPEYFATQTVPMYGHIMKKANKNWQKSIDPLTSFTELVVSEINLKVPNDVKSASKRLERIYDGPAITASENARSNAAEAK